MRQYLRGIRVLIAGIGLVLASRATAEPFSLRYTFTALNWGTNLDGAHPHAGFLLSGNTLYGTGSAGGSAGNGVVFKINTDGSNFIVLYDLGAGSTNAFGVLTNDNGANPYGELVLSSNTLYGTTSQGGNFGNGTVFRDHQWTNHPAPFYRLRWP
jgi:uncharacterized repeat protein (TIGR03803 family)